MASPDHLRTAVLVLLLACFPLVSTAQTKLDAQTRDRLVQLLSEAEQKLSEKKYQEAIDRLTEADKILPAPTVRLEIARARAKMGQILEAQRLMQDIARATPPKNERPEWTKARQSAEQEAASLTARLSIVEISVEGLTEGTTPEVLWDGQGLSVALLGIPRPVNPGAHVLKVGAKDFRMIEKTVTLQEGETQRIRLTMQSVPRDAPVASSSPPVPVPPPVPPPVVAPLASSVLPLPPAPEEPPAEKTGGWIMPVGFSALGVFGVAGTVLGVLSLSKTGTVKDECPTKSMCPSSAQSDIDGARTMGTLSTVSFVLAGAGGGLALYGLLRDSKSSTDLVLGAGSLQFRGRF